MTKKNITQDEKKRARRITQEVYRLRKELNMSQQALADKADICTATVMKAETTENSCYSLHTLLRICSALNTPLSNLLQRIGL